MYWDSQAWPGHIVCPSSTNTQLSSFLILGDYSRIRLYCLATVFANNAWCHETVLNFNRIITHLSFGNTCQFHNWDFGVILGVSFSHEVDCVRIQLFVKRTKKFSKVVCQLNVFSFGMVCIVLKLLSADIAYTELLPRQTWWLNLL